MRISRFFCWLYIARKLYWKAKVLKSSFFLKIFHSQIFTKIYEKSLDFCTGSSRYPRKKDIQQILLSYSQIWLKFPVHHGHSGYITNCISYLLTFELPLDQVKGIPLCDMAGNHAMIP
jgi:hypothetical protein